MPDQHFNWAASYAAQRPAADLLLPAQIDICRQVFDEDFREATELEDREEGSDLIGLTTGRRIACRVRDHDQKRFEGQFTVRLHPNRKGVNELEKIISGFGSFMLYGFKTEDGQQIANWWLIDLDVFRAAAADQNFGNLSMMNPVKRAQCHFQPFKLNAFEDYGKLVIASGV